MQERNQTYLRRKNKEDIINLLRERSQSYSEIARALKLSNTAVGKIADALIADNLILRDGDTKGRTGINLQINADFGYVVAIDLSGRKLTVCAADFRSNVLVRREIAEVVSFSKSDLNALIDAVRGIVNGEECKGRRLCCISIASPGIIDRASGEFLLNPRFKGFKGVSLEQVFSEEFKCRTVVRNDINLAFEGEKVYGTFLKDVMNALMFHIDVGTGAAIIIDGKVYEGTHGFAGEIGYFKLNMFATDPNGLENLNYANYYDSLSLYSSLAMVMREVLADPTCPLAVQLKSEGVDPHDVTIRHMVDSYASGDVMVRRIIDASGRVIGTVANNLAEFLDIDTIVLSGTAVELGESFLAVVASCLNGKTVRFSSLMENAPLMGAVNTGLTQAFADNI